MGEETLQLDESTHTYWIGKRKFDSVSRILQELHLCNDYTGISSFYAERGTAVHKAVEFVDKGTLDDATVDPAIGGYVQAYRRFLRESGYVPMYWEVALHHEQLGFAGSIDKGGKLKDKFGIIDIKTSSSVDPAVDAQLCGYNVLWNENHPELPVEFKYALQLKPDGTYNLITKYSATSVDLWLSIMDVYRWKQKRRFAA
jgi:hypothetical protein